MRKGGIPHHTTKSFCILAFSRRFSADWRGVIPYDSTCFIVKAFHCMIRASSRGIAASNEFIQYGFHSRIGLTLMLKSRHGEMEIWPEQRFQGLGPAHSCIPELGDTLYTWLERTVGSEQCLARYPMSQPSCW